MDLIITDLHMPDMDGIEFVREVRLSEKIDLIPVLMITSDYNTDKMLEAYDAVSMSSCKSLLRQSTWRKKLKCFLTIRIFF